MKKKAFSLILNSLIIGSLSILAFACNSKTEGGKETTFKVYGNCGMCKKTIEGSLAKDIGVLSAEWDKDTKMMTVHYDSTKTNEMKIHHAIASSGYDTEVERGNDEAYKNLHECCQYQRKQ